MAEPLPGHLSNNIETISALTQRSQEEVSRHQRFIEHVTAQLARPRTLYGIFALVLAWILFNTWGGGPDPAPFVALQTFCTVAALCTTVMVLITQRRQDQMARRREELELQVNIVTEQKATKLIALLEELRRDLPNVRNREDRTAAEMAQSADPKEVLRVLEEKVLPELDK